MKNGYLTNVELIKADGSEITEIVFVESDCAMTARLAACDSVQEAYPGARQLGWRSYRKASIDTTGLPHGMGKGVYFCS